MESHYPTSAELAAFRRTLGDPGPAGVTYWLTGAVLHPDGGAWPYEREHGIGWSAARAPLLDPWAKAAYARREAGRMRREQYESGSELRFAYGDR